MPITDPNRQSTAAQSAVFLRDSGVHPGLKRRDTSWGLGMVAICLLGVATFMWLSNARQSATAQPVAKIPVAETPAPVSQPMHIAAYATEPAPAPALPRQVDMRAPALIVDFSQGAAAERAAGTAAPAPGTLTASNDDKLTADERFSARTSASQVDVARATQLRDLLHTAPQGTVIPAILETAINSDLPGFVRAVVSRDVRGFDGSTILVPRGSKLIGQYRSAVALSQTRAFVVWTRILTPDGVSIDIASPATDRLGRGGLDGETDSHFFERFGSAILLSVMSAGLSALSEPSNNNTSIVIGSTQQASQIASIAMQKQIDIPVTISVPQGTPLQVFLTRDLDFSGVAPAKP